MFFCRSWNGRWPNRSRELTGNDLSPLRSSGNHAFDEYREETLRRLEDEQNEFNDFLDRLRMAKDRAEFDEFMGSRSAQPSSAPKVSSLQGSI